MGWGDIFPYPTYLIVKIILKVNKIANIMMKILSAINFLNLTQDFKNLSTLKKKPETCNCNKLINLFCYNH